MVPLRKLIWDRSKLLGWALVFVVGALLANPIAFELGRLVSTHQGIMAGVIVGLLAAGLMGFTVTAVVISRSSDLGALPADERRKVIVRLYAAALCIVVGLFIEAFSLDFAPSAALPVSAVVVIIAVLIARSLERWGLRQAGDPDRRK